MGIPLVALNAAPPPQANPVPDALSEFQRASALKTAAGQQALQQQQIQGNQLALQQQQQQMEDWKKLRDLGPTHVQRDADGKVTGFDTEGYLNDAAAINPQLAAALREKYYEGVMKSAQATKAQRDNEREQNQELHDIGAGLQDVAEKNRSSNTTTQGPTAAPTAATPQQTAPNASAPVAGTGGMPAFALPNLPHLHQRLLSAILSCLV